MSDKVLHFSRLDAKMGTDIAERKEADMRKQQVTDVAGRLVSEGGPA